MTTCSPYRAHRSCRQEKAFLLLLFLLIFIWHPCAIAQANSSLLVIFSRPDFTEASAIAAEYKARFPNTAVYQAPNGQYAVAIGRVEKGSAPAFLEKYKQSGDIPADSFASNLPNWIGPLVTPPPPLPRAENNTPKFAPLNATGAFLLRGRSTYKISKSQTYDYEARQIYVPAWSFASITTMRRNGKCDLNLFVVESIQANTLHRVAAQGLVAKNIQSDESPNTLIIAASDQPRTLYLYMVDEVIDECDYAVAASTIDIRDAAAHALVSTMVHMALTELFGGGSQQAPAMSDRLLPLASSIIQRDNMLSVGLDVAINEARLQIKKSFPNNEGMVVFGTEWIAEILHGLYDNAFAMASGSR